VYGVRTVKQDVVVIRMAAPPAKPGNPQALPDPKVRDPERDVLWVECKAPEEDTPAGWKNLMMRAGARLEEAHPNRMLYVILAIGLKWMFFKWDPLSPRPPLQVLADNRTGVWNMSPYYHYESAVAGQFHVIHHSLPGQPATEVIDTTMAYSLNFWTPHPQAPQQPANMHAMQLLEACFRHIQSTHFVGDNSPGYN
jgi:hypothetical protein